MEKSFIVDSKSELYKMYQEYRKLCETNDAAIKEFVNKTFENKQDYLYLAGDVFSITFTLSELNLFGSQLRKDSYLTTKGVMCHFKKRSAVGRAYSKLGLQVACKPVPGMFVNDIRVFRNKLFEWNGTLYCSVDSDDITENTVFPYGWIPMRLSDFYEIIESKTVHY